MSFSLHNKRFQRHWSYAMNLGYPRRDKKRGIGVFQKRWGFVIRILGKSRRRSRRVILGIWAGCWCEQVWSRNMFCHSWVVIVVERLRVKASNLEFGTMTQSPSTIWFSSSGERLRVMFSLECGIRILWLGGSWRKVMRLDFTRIPIVPCSILVFFNEFGWNNVLSLSLIVFLYL